MAATGSEYNCLSQTLALMEPVSQMLQHVPDTDYAGHCANLGRQQEQVSDTKTWEPK